jgi:hypothetical protein
MFYSFLGTYLEPKNTLKPIYKETWAENFYSPKDMQSLGLKFEAPVLNGTSSKGRNVRSLAIPLREWFNRLNILIRAAVVYVTLFGWIWEKQALLLDTYLNRQYNWIRTANFDLSLGM